MEELIIRFLVGGLVVSFFAIVGDACQPKSFAGLFGAAPSVALATLGLTIISDGKLYASIDARSMIGGAAALFFYSLAVSRVLQSGKWSALRATSVLIFAWFACAFAFWFAFWR
jgi:hypothetical protein